MGEKKGEELKDDVEDAFEHEYHRLEKLAYRTYANKDDAEEFMICRSTWDVYEKMDEFSNNDELGAAFAMAVVGDLGCMKDHFRSVDQLDLSGINDQSTADEGLHMIADVMIEMHKVKVCDIHFTDAIDAIVDRLEGHSGDKKRLIARILRLAGLRRK